jgi:hypothetical protein
VARPQGYATWTQDGRTVEADTFTCAHDQRVVFMKPAKAGGPAPDIGGFCRQCMANICGPCADKGTCTPFLRKLEIQEGRRRLTDVVLGSSGA